jgi:hypothetical protein
MEEETIALEWEQDHQHYKEDSPTEPIWGSAPAIAAPWGGVSSYTAPWGAPLLLLHHGEVIPFT